ncbi:MAG TPA: EamA family transporter [Candidatus Limnocylindrales bacterium]|nr:EamA family transporter [Candidatus Limnocylindrales bacterium]
MPTSAGRSSALPVALALGTVYIVWGSTYLAIAYVVETLPPLLAAAARFLLAGGLIVGFLVAQDRWRQARGQRGTLNRPRLVEWRTALIVGSLLLLGGNGLVSLAEQRIPSGIAAVMIATVPIWMSLFEAVLNRRAPTMLAVGGIAVGLAGAVILLLPTDGLDSLDPTGVGMVAVSAMAWAAGSIYARRGPLPQNQLLGTGMQQLAGALALVVVGLSIGEPGRFDVAAVSAASLLGLAYLIVFGSLAAFTAYVWLLHHAPVTTVATYAYVNPVVAVSLGIVFRNEPLTPRTLLAAALIIGAVVAMVSGRPRVVDEPAAGSEAAALEPADDAT